MLTYITDRYPTVQYDGTNASEIAALFNTYSLVSEGGGTLTFTANSSGPYSVSTTEWVRSSQGSFAGVFTDTQYHNWYIEVADASTTQADLDGLDGRVTDLEAIPAGVAAAGLKETPTLLASQSATVAVDLTPAMPNTSYTVHATLVGPSTALGSLSITSTSIVDTDTVNVVVQNSGLLSLSGIHLLVVATS